MNKLIEFVNKNQKFFINKGQQNESIIITAETELKIKFGPQLKQYLLLFGFLSYKSVEFLGLGLDDNSHLNLVKATKKLRNKFSLPEKFVPIINLGDGNYAVCDENDIILEFYYNNPPVNMKIKLEDYMLEKFYSAI